MEEKYFGIKLYVGDKLLLVGEIKLYGPGAEAKARMAFDIISSGLGNPHVDYGLDIAGLGDDAAGEATYNLEAIEYAELIELTTSGDEEILDNASREQDD